MTDTEERHIEKQFGNLADIFETKLKASEEVICEKVSNLKGQIVEMRSVVNTHIEWHNSVNRNIVSNVVKYGLMGLGCLVIIVFIIGVTNGVIPAVLAKAIG